MAIAYFDCFAGAAGDMIAAALVDAGASIESLRAEIAKLGLEGVHLSVETVQRGGIAALHFQVHEHEADPAHDHGHEAHDHGHGHEHNHDHAHDHGHDAGHHGHAHAHPHRRLSDILEMIQGAGLAERVVERARRIFQRLAEAEAKVHGTGIEEVHFHEVGAVDSIVDVVAGCVGLELLGVDRVVCGAIPLGSGTVTCEHGELPVPAPATAQLIVGVPTRGAEIAGEATTPTGAAVLTTLAESYGPLPPMDVAAIGHGAGTREGRPLPNILRVFVGEEAGDGQVDSVVELAANVDDCTGEMIGAAIEKLLAAGCLDAWAAPIVMKKSRPAWQVSVLCSPHDVPEAERILFAETTTFGVRRRTCGRTKLRRAHDTVETPYGPIRVKVGRRGDEDVTAAPEFEDCRLAAEAHHVSVKEVLAAALAIHRQVPRRGE